MRIFLVMLLLSLVSAGEVYGQNAASVAPDCGPFILNLTAAGNVPSAQGYANEQSVGGFGAGGCASWTLMYTSVGFTALTLAVQSAPSATITTPGAYVSYTGTIVTGINPNTSTVGAQSTFNNGAVSIPWIRANLSGLTGAGTVAIVLYGYKSGSVGNASVPCPGTAAVPCVVDGVTAAGSPPTTPPMLVAGQDGTNIRTIKTDVNGNIIVAPGNGCPNSAAVSLTLIGLTQIIAASGTTAVTICHVSVGFAASVDFQLEYGTGANCATGTTAKSGVYKAILAVALDTPFSFPASQAVCVNLGAGVTGGGLIVYQQQ